MATGIPIFPGQSEIDQIFRIMQKLGTPTSEMWPEVRSWGGYVVVFLATFSNDIEHAFQQLETLPHFQPVFPTWPSCPFSSLTSSLLPPSGLTLLSSLLRYDPKKRLTCTDALGTDYLKDVDSEYTFDIPSIRRTVTEEQMESPG